MLLYIFVTENFIDKGINNGFLGAYIVIDITGAVLTNKF